MDEGITIFKHTHTHTHTKKNQTKSLGIALTDYGFTYIVDDSLLISCYTPFC